MRLGSEITMMRSLSLASACSLFACFLLILPSIGCRICLDNHDLDYPTYGGAWQRTTRDSGRVGSLFEPAGAKVATLVDRDEPPTPDWIDRMKHSGGTDQPDDSAVESPSDAVEMIDPTDELMERKLDDIEEEKEEEDLRVKQLDEIEIQVKRKRPEA